MSRSVVPVSGPAERFFELSLLGLVTSGYLAVLGSGYLDLPTAAATALALVLRLLLTMRLVRFSLSTRTVAALTAAYIAFYPIDYLWVSGDFLTATVHLIFFLAILKVLTARTNRDYFFVKMIAFMELLAAAVLSNQLNFFAFLALFLFCGVCTFAASEVRRSGQMDRRVSRVQTTRFQWHLAGLTASTAIGILVLTGGLFFLLPRTARAAFRHLASQRYRLAGFSNEVELGQLGELKMSGAPVMHVKIDQIEHGVVLKWRGAALRQFDGRRWFNPPQPGEALRVQEALLRLADNRQQWRKGPRISYEVVMQAIDSDALFFAGIPEFLRIAAPVVYRLPGDTYRTGLGYGEGVRYYAYSYLPNELFAGRDEPEPLPEPMRREYLQLPSVDPRIAGLTRRLTESAPTDYDAARAVERHLRSDYRYTTDLLEAEVGDPLAYFLFVRRKGHCEYFASAMAVMLREMGIPARVITGFQSGTFNPMTGWHLIRTSDAHSWVEAYLNHRGWTTFDPTPPDNRPRGTGLLARLALLGDAADTFWQEWVLNYNRERQFDLALRLDSSGRSMSLSWLERWQHKTRTAAGDAVEAAKKVGLGVVAFAACIVLLRLLWPQLRDLVRQRRHSKKLARGEVSPHDATVLYQRMLTTLRKRGFEKPPWLTPAEFAGVLPGSVELLPVVEDLTEAYHRLRYGGDRGEAARMIELLGRLEAARVGTGYSTGLKS